MNATPYLLIEHHADGTKTSIEHVSKKAAHEAGRAARAAGRTVFAFSKADAIRFGMLGQVAS